ncbi:MAG TPA: AMP-binding protein, partial [Iamia sp.]|nr:AMP-binding protein [Iamia sp.]
VRGGRRHRDDPVDRDGGGPMNVAAILDQTARLFPDRPAVAVGGTDTWTYGDVADRAARLARSLLDGGLRPGDRVAIVMENNGWYIESLFAVWWAGLVAVPVNARLHPREVEYILDDSGAAACLVSEPLEDHLRDVPAEVQRLVVGSRAHEVAVAAGSVGRHHTSSPSDAAWLFYTSGTTGRPKGAVLTHRNLMAAATSFLADAGSFSPGGSILHLAPLSHASGITGLALTARATRHVVPDVPSFDPAYVSELLRRYERSTFFAVPTMITRLVREGMDAAALDHLQTIFYGGAPMYVEDLRAAIDALGRDRLWQGYGQGEAPGTITHLPPWLHVDPDHPRHDEVLASVGVPRSGVELRVVDEDGRPVPSGEIGEVTVRGDVVMQGYWNLPEASAVALRDGWLHTGDLGSLDDHGLLTLRDRSKDVIISGGSNIYPREIEEVLLRHPRVVDVAVVGRPDADWGEAVVAFVVADGIVPEHELDARCAAAIARYKRPRSYVFVDALPLSTIGKVLKSELRATFTSPDPPAAGSGGPP